jgi:hypothetical protein
MSRLHARTIFISTVSAFALLAAGTSAGAAITGGPVDNSGVIHGCWTNAAINGTHVVVLQDTGTTCPKGTTAITWNQQGPAGAAGPAGPAGAAGPVGPAGLAGPKGDTGAQGPAGATGPVGPAGPAGTDGNTVLNGTGAPQGNLGKDGDFYLDTTADVLYGPKANGAWPVNGVSLAGIPGAAGPAGPAGPQGPVGPLGLTGPQGPAGANGNTVLNGAGAPGSSVGNDGDFYLDTTADVLYGPKSGGAWPVNGVSLAGPPGSPGTGATVTSLAAGDTHCANGGAAITDGSSHTAYACTGATGPPGPAGSADLQPTTAYSIAGFLHSGGGFTDVPGLTVQVAPTAASTYLVNANIVAMNQSFSANTDVTCTVEADGSAADSGSSQATLAPNPGGAIATLATISVSTMVSLGAGSHTFQASCSAENGSGTIAAIVGSFTNAGGQAQSTMTVLKAS